MAFTRAAVLSPLAVHAVEADGGGGGYKINALENAVVIKRVASGQSRLSESNVIDSQQRSGVNADTRRIRKKAQEKRKCTMD